MATSDEQNQDSMLGLSDAEIAGMNPADFTDIQEEDDTGSGDTDQTQDDTTEDAAAAAEADDGGEQDTDTSDGDGDTEADSEDDETDSDADTETDVDGDETDSEDDDKDTTDDTDDDSDDPESEDDTEETDKDKVDYKAEYEKLLAPFRANGKDMQVQSIDEARQLMQMGANYNKKMAGLKPNLKMMKMLENNELLDEGKLNELIDIKKGNPQAIQKLIKDSGVDPLEFEEGKESEYKPNTYNVDDREVELDSVLDEIQDTPSYPDTINVVSTKWDSDSKQTIAENPQVLKVLNDHMASGIYGQISKEVERERAFGRLNGVSDLDAYKQVGDAMDARGAFAPADNQNAGNETGQQKKSLGTKKVDRSKKTEDPKTKQQKRAASSTKASASSNKSQDDFNPLAMSDDEIEQMTNKSLM